MNILNRIKDPKISKIKPQSFGLTELLTKGVWNSQAHIPQSTPGPWFFHWDKIFQTDTQIKNDKRLNVF